MGSCAIFLAHSYSSQAANAEEFIKTPGEEPTALEQPWGTKVQNFLNFGPVKFNADASLTGEYSDNIFVTRNNKVGDTAVIFKPSITASINAARHEFNMRTGAKIGRYNRFASENYNDYNVGADGKLRLGDTSSVIAGAEYDWTHEGRESPDAVDGLEPTKYQHGNYWLGLLHRSNKIVAKVGGTLNTYDFNNVLSSTGIINNHDRDRKEIEAGGRFGYRINQKWEPFIQSYVDRRYYDSPIDDFGFDRDSKGYRLAAGLRGNAGPSIQGEVYAGYIRQNYSDAALPNVSAIDFGMRLDWKAAPGTTVRSFVDRTVEETTLSAASAYLSTTAGASVEHVIRSDLQLNAHLYYTENDYKGVLRTDHLTDLGMGLKYFFTPNLYVGTEYAHIQRLSTSATGEFSENRFLIRIGAQLAPAYREDPQLSVPTISGRGVAGFYIGLQGGHGALVSGVDGTRGGGGSLTADFGDEGWQGGAFVGYGVLVKRVYMGLELGTETGEQSWRHDGTGGTRIFSVSKRESYELSARLGYELKNQSLVYGRFGVVSTKFHTPYNHSGNLVSVDDRERGMRYGGGTDFPLGDNFFGRMEYTFTSYADYNVYPNSPPDNFSNGENLVRFGLGYRFNAGPSEEATPVVDYNGFYLGAAIGHGVLMTNNAGFRNVPQTLDASRAGFGSGAGLIGGYGRTIGSIYVGAELEGELSSLDWNIKRDPTGRIYSVDKQYSYGAAVRLGYVLRKNTLLYGKAGLVRTRFSTDYATTGNVAYSDKTMSGIRLGGGLEMPVSKSTNLRLEYTWTDHGTYGLRYSNAPNGTDTFKNTENQFRVGLIYKF